MVDDESKPERRVHKHMPVRMGQERVSLLPTLVGAGFCGVFCFGGLYSGGRGGGGFLIVLGRVCLYSSYCQLAAIAGEACGVCRLVVT